MRCIAILGLVVALCACDDDTDDQHHDEHGAEAAADACEHMKDGPAQAVTAAATEADAPVVSIPHTRVDVTLTDHGGANGGFLRFEADEAGEVVFFFGADVPVKVGGAALSGGEPVDACAEAAVHYELDLDVGPVTIEVGPTDETSVGFVFVETGHEEHDD